MTRLIVTHHHFDHTAGLRAAVSRGLAVISHRGNEAIFHEMIARPAIVFPDELARSPRPLVFTPVDGKLVLEDATQRLEIYHVLGHSHMANAVFAYLPASRIMMEGDLGDAQWTWHWWANALNANIKAYGIDPRLNVAVHGPDGGFSIDVTLATTSGRCRPPRNSARLRGEPECPCLDVRCSTTSTGRLHSPRVRRTTDHPRHDTRVPDRQTLCQSPVDDQPALRINDQWNGNHVALRVGFA